MTSRFDPSLTAAFTEQGLLERSGQPVHLPSACPKCSECWRGALGRAPAVGTPSSQITPPWVGSKYSSGGVLVLLINLNGYGGWDLRDEADVGMRHLGRLARTEFAQGRRRLFSNSDYRGTAVWTQAVSYAAIWLSRTSGFHCRWEGDRVGGESLAEALDHVAITQHVKCSPTDKSSVPTDAMWNACGAHVLSRELSVLQPGRIVVVGTDSNISELRRSVLREPATRQSARTVHAGSKSLTVTLEVGHPHEGRSVDLLVVPHPAAPGGNNTNLLRAADRVVAEAFDTAGGT